MTTAVVFDWLIFGWIYYLIAYALLPLMILVTKKFLDTNDLRYALINGLILAVVMEQPTFILIYPLLGFLFALFESRFKLKMILRGLILTAISLSIWFLTALSFFTSYNSAESFSSYQGYLFLPTLGQFSHLSSLLNPMRLWGSTFNYQFETYFPKELFFLSFVPIFLAIIGLLSRPRDRRVLFAAIAYFFAFFAYLIYGNFHFFVYNLPYGSIWEAPSVFLVPAALGLALLIGYANQTFSNIAIKFNSTTKRKIVRLLSFALILILIVCASIPWWTGQTSGSPIPGPAIKLNLYSTPNGYTAWSNQVKTQNSYFVLYLPLYSANVQIANTTYFSLPYEGVNGAIYLQINGLPYISSYYVPQYLRELTEASSQVGQSWGSVSIKYIVVYTNVESAYNTTEITSSLSRQSGIVEVANMPGVVVYENDYAKPVVYANNATTQITYQDPTTYKLQANSTSPFLLVLNQGYSNGWTASVNGKQLTTHENDTGFNSWYINDAGNMTIEIYYAPQTTYIATMIASIAVIISVLVYIILATVRNVKRARKQ